jgi:hippurate hydrolase
MAINVEALYRDLHANPELSFAEYRTSGIVATHLEQLGFSVITSIGRTGVVGILENGAGATVLLRADMDGLPVREQSGVDYASTATGVTAEGETVPVMHACGHDVHVACLIGAAEKLSETRNEWSGTLVVLFQPAEETGGGAQAMVEDGLYTRVPKPDVVLGQHVAPFPAGALGLRVGPAFAGADALSIRMIGQGGHGSQPERTVDAVVMAAATVLRLQTIVSREVAPAETAALTVGMIHGGSRVNIIPPEVELGISLRSFSAEIRERMLDSIRRIAEAEAAASGAPEKPVITFAEHFPVLVNDAEASARVIAALEAISPVIDPGPVAGSEDVGLLAEAVGVPIVYWLLGGSDPEAFAAATARGTVERDIPSNHSPFFAPLPQPTLDVGVRALVEAARAWLVV